MIRIFSTALLSVLFILPAYAQRPQNIKLTANPTQNYEDQIQIRSTPNMCNEAGTISFANPTGQSNDIDINSRRFFLCLGDMFNVLHNGDFNVDGSPNPNDAGVGYAFYDEFPTIDGPDLNTILTDPSLNTTSPILLNGMPVPQTQGVWIASDGAAGNIQIVNDGTLQSAFNNGVPAPVQFWFAPITIDNVNTIPPGYESFPGGDPGPCVDVNPDFAFSVVYLNGLEISMENNNVTPETGCSGSFTITGGLPEFDVNEFYTVTIQLQGDPSVVAAINSLPGHGDEVQFSVPQPGIYDIIVEDGKSCGASTTMDFTACQAITLNLPFLNANPGDTDVCLDLTVEDFTNIAALQFSLNWDPAVLSLGDVRNLNSNMPGLTLTSLGTNNAGNGVLTFVWPSSIGFASATLADGETLFQICFDVIGSLGDRSPVSFGNDPTPIQVGDNTPVPDGPLNLGVITNDGQVNLSTNSIFLELEATDAVCNGENTGNITVKFDDGTEPYNIFFDQIPSTGAPTGPIGPLSGINQQDIPNLAAGEYEVIVQDDAGNEVRDTVIINDPPSIGVRFLIIDPECFGDSIPEVRVEVRENNVRVDNPGLTYDFMWDTPFGNNLAINSPFLNDVPEGAYSVSVTNANGCFEVAASSIFSPDQITVPVPNIAVTDATCSGAFDGEVSISASGGTSATGNYSYQWENGLSETDVSSVNLNLDPGVYFVTITDDNSCEVVDSFEVSASKILTLDALPTDVLCFGDSTGNVVANIETSIGTESLPYTFSWTDAAGEPLVNIVSGPRSETASELPAGTYFLQVTDSDPRGCSVSDSIVIAQPDSLLIELVEQVDETCENGGGAMDGSAIIEVSGGTFAYEYLWTTPMMEDTVAMDSIAVMLSADTLSARVTDMNGCIDSLEVIIRAPPPPAINSITTDVLDCFNDSDGMLMVNASPTVSPISFIEWFDEFGNPVGAGPTAQNLGVGVYFVRVLGENECASGDSTFVTAPSPISIDSIVVVQTPTCPGDPNGRLAVFASGGNPDFTYIWENTPTNDVLNNPVYPGLTAGDYQVTVVDGNNCEEVVGNATVADPPSIEITFSAIDSTSCFSGDCDGGAMATAIYSDGTVGTFDFTWSSTEITMGVDVSTASQLCAGANLLTVSDASCFSTDSVMVPSPLPIVPNVSITDITCNGDADGTATVNPSGGSAPYNLLWGTGQTTNQITDLLAGSYVVTITDANACNFVQIVNIEEPPQLFLSVNEGFSEDVRCSGSSDGIITLLPTGGTRPYAFQWSDGDTSMALVDLGPGVYFATVTDANGCTDSLSANVNEPPAIMAVIPQPPAPRCFGDPTTLLIDTVFGGNGMTLSDYVYSINGSGIGFPVDQPTTIFNGANVVTIEDFNGCTFSDTITVVQPDLLEIIFDPPTVIVELGDSTVELDPLITNNSGIPIDSFIWQPGDFLSATNVPTPTVSPIRSQEYQLTVIDINGCSATNTVFVEVDANRNVHIPSAFSPNGDGENDIFSIFTCNGVSEIKAVRVFDRWGELMHESTGLTPNCEPGIGVQVWDGRFNGQELNPGVFVYVVEVGFIDGVELTYRGSIALLK